MSDELSKVKVTVTAVPGAIGYEMRVGADWGTERIVTMPEESTGTIIHVGEVTSLIEELQQVQEMLGDELMFHKDAYDRLVRLLPEIILELKGRS